MITEWSLYGHSIKANQAKIIGTSIEATAGQLLHEIVNKHSKHNRDI